MLIVILCILAVIFFVTLKEYKQALREIQQKIRCLETELILHKMAIQVLEKKTSKPQKDL